VKWTFWYYPPKGHAWQLIPSVGERWAPRYAVPLWDVRGCQYAGQQDGLPVFEVPGHGQHVLTLEQALFCKIVRIPESEAGSAAVKRLDPR
jgi:hypothetical protein